MSDDKNPTPPVDKNPPADKAPKAKLVKARVLVDGAAGAINTVVEADAEQIKSWAKDGLVDPHPSAVAHAEKLASGETASDADKPLE